MTAARLSDLSDFVWFLGRNLLLRSLDSCVNGDSSVNGAECFLAK